MSARSMIRTAFPDGSCFVITEIDVDVMTKEKAKEEKKKAAEADLSRLS